MRNSESYISDKIKAIEDENNVNVILAIETGSRLWGFPSKDSDYDVRFIYAGEAADYLTIKKNRDVIECPLNHDSVLGTVLDINGWDIKKAIYLAGKGNRALIEWVQSDIIYAANGMFPEFKEHVIKNCNLSDLQKHYIGWTKSIWDQKETDQIKIKNYFYCLRTSLCAAYIAKEKKIPHPNMWEIINACEDFKYLLEPLQALNAQKEKSDEKATTKRVAILDKFINKTLEIDIIPSGKSGTSDDQDNALFQKIIKFHNQK